MDIGTLTVTLMVDAGPLEAAAAAFGKFRHQTIASLSMMSQRMRTFGYLSSITLTAPMVAAAKQSLEAAKDYEFSMQKIVGLTGTAQETVNAWGDDVIRISKQYGKLPQELAEALYFIASSGIQGAEAMNVLEISAKAAASGLGTTQKVADYLTSVLNAYRGTGLTAAYATDVLVAAVREGKAEAEGFASAMGQVIPIASQLRVPIDQVAGAMAAITLTGSTAAQAGVYLKNIFNALLKEAGGGAEAMTQASIALSGMNTTFADLRRILAEDGIIALMQKIKDLSSVYGETLVSEVFPEIRAMTGALSLMGKNFEYNSVIMQRITDSNGALAQAFGAVSNTIKVKYDRAIASLNASLITLGKELATALLPILDSLIKKVEEITEWFSTLTEQQKRTKLIMVLLVAAIGPLSLILSTVGYSVVILMNSINALSTAFAFLLRRVSIVGAFMKLKAAFQGIFLGAEAVTGALGATAIAAQSAAVSFASLAGFLGVFGVAAWLLVDNVIVPLVKKIKDMRQEMQDTLDLAHGTDLQMDLSTSISNRMWDGSKYRDLSQLSQTALEQLQTDIQQRMALEQEDLDNAKYINVEKIKNEEDYLKKVRELDTLEQRWKDAQFELNKTIGPEDLKRIGSNIAMQKQVIERSMQDYITNRLAESKIDQDLSTRTIKLYEDYGARVAKALKDKTGPAEQAQKELEALIQRTKEVSDAFYALSFGEKFIAEMTKVLGGSFDDVAERSNLYRQVLESLIDIQVKAGYQIPEVAAKIKELATALNQLRSIKIDRDLQNIAGLSSIFGDSFNANADAVQVLESALSDFNTQTRGMASAFSAMGISGMAFQAVLDGLIIRWNKYRTAAFAEESGKSIKNLQLQANAFQTIELRIALMEQELENYNAELEKMGTGELPYDEGRYSELVDRIRKVTISLAELQGQADVSHLEKLSKAFGTLDSQMEVIEARMDSVTAIFEAQKSVGAATDEVYKQYATDILNLSIEQLKLQDAMDIQPLQIMSKEFGRLEDQLALVSEQINIAKRNFILFSTLASMGMPGAVIGMEAARESLKAYIAEQRKLQATQQVYSALASGMVDFFGAVGKAMVDTSSGMEDVVSSLLGVAERIISILLAEAAAALLAGETIKGMGIPGLIAGMVAVGALRAAWESAKTTSTGAAKLAEGGIIPSGYPNDSFPALLSSGEAVIPLDKMEDLFKKYPAVFKIVDERKIDLITQQPVSPYSKLHGTLDLSFVEEIVRKALERGIDPYTALAIPHQETGGTASGSANPYAINYTDEVQWQKLIADPIGASLDILQQKLKLADKLGYDTYAYMVQVYNGMGKLTRGAVGGSIGTQSAPKAYGIEIPEEGISMKQNPLYGKRIEDVRNNIIMQNEELVSFVESLMKDYGQPTLPSALYKTPEPILPEYVQPISVDTTTAITSANDALQQFITSMGYMSSETLSGAQSADKAAGKFGNLASATGSGLSNIIGTAIQGGDVGSAAISAMPSIFNSLLSLIPGVGPILQMLLGGIGGGIFSGMAQRMATGGIVPSGFPNDTYPALLTSGETVLPREYRDMPDMLAHLTKQGSIPSGTISDELQLLLSTFEINFPEEKFKSLLSPLLKQRPVTNVEKAFDTKRKLTSKIYNVNNYTNNLTKITKDQALKNSSITKQLGKFSKSLPIQTIKNSAVTKQLSKLSKGMPMQAVKNTSITKQLSKLSQGIPAQTAKQLTKTAFGNEKMFSSLTKASQAMKGAIPRQKISASNPRSSIQSDRMLEQLFKMKRSNDKSLGYLTHISKGTDLTDRLLANAEYYPRVARMAMGGQVPSGYPNDSFPAMLSSGEYVLPKNVQRNIRNIEQKPQKIHIELGGKVLGKDLALVLRRLTQYQ